MCLILLFLILFEKICFEILQTLHTEKLHKNSLPLRNRNDKIKKNYNQNRNIVIYWHTFKLISLKKIHGVFRLLWGCLYSFLKIACATTFFVFKCQTPMSSSKDIDNINDICDPELVVDTIRNKDEASMNENGTWNYLKQRRNLLLSDFKMKHT